MSTVVTQLSITLLEFVCDSCSLTKHIVAITRPCMEYSRRPCPGHLNATLDRDAIDATELSISNPLLLSSIHLNLLISWLVGAVQSMRLIPHLSRDESSHSESSDSSEGSSKSGEMAGVTAMATEHFLRSRPQLAPYETPPSDGSSPLSNCPPEVLVNIFSRLDRVTFTKCMRVCLLHSHRSRLRLSSIA